MKEPTSAEESEEAPKLETEIEAVEDSTDSEVEEENA